MAGFPKAGDEYADRYRVVRELGHGGTGIVYEAVDALSLRPVALKVVVPSRSDREVYRARFARESAVLAGIRSDHIVSIHDHGEHQDTVYVVTALFPDGSLDRWLESHPVLARRAALLLVSQVCGALAEAHTQGVVHGDLKPSKVLLRDLPEGPVPSLCDFGAALGGRHGLAPTGVLVGSPAYLAPERHFGHAPDERGDIYSAGCLLWAVLSGGPPYAGSDFAMMNAHINEPTPQLGTGHPVDQRIDEVLAGAMRKDPAARPATAEEVRQQLLAIIDAVDSHART